VSVLAGDIEGTTANARKAIADVSDTADVKATTKRAIIACRGSYNTGEVSQPQTTAGVSKTASASTSAQVSLYADTIAPIVQEEPLGDEVYAAAYKACMEAVMSKFGALWSTPGKF